MTDIDRIINKIIGREGNEFTNHPLDSAGPTRYGVTIAAMTEWLGRQATENDIRNLTKDTAREIYRKLYVLLPRFDKITDTVLRRQLIDCGVLHGRRWAIRRLQEIIYVRVDGIIGPITLKGVNFNGRLNELSERFLYRRIRRCVRIVQHDKIQAVWLWGWIKRALDVYFEG